MCWGLHMLGIHYRYAGANDVSMPAHVLCEALEPLPITTGSVRAGCVLVGRTGHWEERGVRPGRPLHRGWAWVALVPVALIILLFQQAASCSHA